MPTKQSTIQTKSLVLIALFVAVTAVCAQISIPLPFTPVPLSLSPIGVYLAGAILKRRDAVIAMLVYLFLGLVGLPVFSRFGAGPAFLVGPTAGYLWSYPAMVLLIGWGKRNVLGLSLRMIAAAALMFTVASLWLAFVQGVSVVSGFVIGAVPYLVGDGVKIGLSVTIALALQRAGFRADSA